ncbi:MAG TPA: hypothetical protein PLF10_07395 [Dokdonella sp.]|nr:hypothetical protein [Dokdonella sp.]
MTDIEQLAKNLRRYNAWRRGAEGVEMPIPKDLSKWIEEWWVKELDGIQASQEATPDQKRAVAVVHNLLRHILKLELPGNVLAQRVEVLEAALLEIADWTDLFARPGHPISKAARAAIAKSREIQSTEAGG